MVVIVYTVQLDTSLFLSFVEHPVVHMQSELISRSTNSGLYPSGVQSPLLHTVFLSAIVATSCAPATEPQLGLVVVIMMVLSVRCFLPFCNLQRTVPPKGFAISPMSRELLDLALGCRLAARWQLLNPQTSHTAATLCSGTSHCANGS